MNGKTFIKTSVHMATKRFNDYTKLKSYTRSCSCINIAYFYCLVQYYLGTVQNILSLKG